MLYTCFRVNCCYLCNIRIILRTWQLNIFPYIAGLNSEPMTALISPDTCSAYAPDAKFQASIVLGLLKSHSGITIFCFSIVDSNVTPPLLLAIFAAFSAPPIPSVLPDQKKAVSGSVFNLGRIASISSSDELLISSILFFDVIKLSYAVASFALNLTTASVSTLLIAICSSSLISANFHASISACVSPG